MYFAPAGSFQTRRCRFVPYMLPSVNADPEDMSQASLRKSLKASISRILEAYHHYNRAADRSSAAVVAAVVQYDA